MGDGEGMFEKIRAVEEVTMIGRDTVVVRGSLLVQDNVGGDSDAIRGNGAVGRHLAQGRGGG